MCRAYESYSLSARALSSPEKLVERPLSLLTDPRLTVRENDHSRRVAAGLLSIQALVRAELVHESGPQSWTLPDRRYVSQAEMRRCLSSWLLAAGPLAAGLLTAEPLAAA